MEQQSAIIDLKLIETWEGNPRKHYDPKGLEDLAKSIGEHGVIEPIIVRPIDKGKRFSIVAGERRYRASVLGAKKDIPCIIRELTDKQALEIAVIENLQRVDVHPLDEAEGFKSLVAQGYDTPGLALKFGMSESYILKRLKILELIPEIRKMFYKDLIMYVHAIVIARLTKPQQKEVLKWLERENLEEDGPPNIGALKDHVARNLFRVLDKAPFDIKDDKLVKKCGSCLNCPKRSGSNNLLFDDMQGGEDTCMDHICYHAKTEAALDLGYKEAKEKGIPVISERYSIDSDVKKRFPGILTSDQWSGSSAKEGGVRAFIVNGWSPGTYRYIKIKGSKISGEKKAPTKKEQIKDLETKLSKGKSKDKQKLSTQVFEKIKDLQIKESPGLDLTSTFGKLFLLDLLDNEHNFRDLVYCRVKGLDPESDEMPAWWDMDEDEEKAFIDNLLNNPPAELSNIVYSHLIQSIASRNRNFDPEEDGLDIGDRGMRMILDLYGPLIDYSGLRQEIDEAGKKRDEKLAKKLEELKNPPAKEPKKTAKKAAGKKGGLKELLDK